MWNNSRIIYRYSPSTSVNNRERKIYRTILQEKYDVLYWITQSSGNNTPFISYVAVFKKKKFSIVLFFIKKIIFYRRYSIEYSVGTKLNGTIFRNRIYSRDHTAWILIPERNILSSSKNHVLYVRYVGRWDGRFLTRVDSWIEVRKLCIQVLAERGEKRNREERRYSCEKAGREKRRAQGGKRVVQKRKK